MTIFFIDPAHSTQAEDLSRQYNEQIYRLGDSGPQMPLSDTTLTLLGHTSKVGNTVWMEELSANRLASRLASNLSAESRKRVEHVFLIACQAGFGNPPRNSFAAKFLKELREKGFTHQNLCVHAAVPPEGSQEVSVEVSSNIGAGSRFGAKLGDITFKSIAANGEETAFATTQDYQKTFSCPHFTFSDESTPKPMSLQQAELIEYIDKLLNNPKLFISELVPMRSFLLEQQSLFSSSSFPNLPAEIFDTIKAKIDKSFAFVTKPENFLAVTEQTNEARRIIKDTLGNSSLLAILEDARSKNQGDKYSHQQCLSFVEQQIRLLTGERMADYTDAQLSALKVIFSKFTDKAFLDEFHGRGFRRSKGDNKIDDILSTTGAAILAIKDRSRPPEIISALAIKSNLRVGGKGDFFNQQIKAPLVMLVPILELKENIEQHLGGLNQSTELEEEKKVALRLVLETLGSEYFWERFNAKDKRKRDDIVFCINQAVEQIVGSQNISETLSSLMVKKRGASGNGNFFIKHIKNPLLKRFNILTKVSVNLVSDNENMKAVVGKIEKILEAIQDSAGAVEEKVVESETEGLLSNNSESPTSVTELLEQIKHNFQTNIRKNLNDENKEKIIKLLDVLGSKHQEISGKPEDERKDILNQIKTAINGIKDSVNVEQCILNLKTTREKLVQPIKPSDGFWTKLNKSSNLASTLHHGEYFRKTFKLNLLEDKPKQKLLEALKHYQRKRSSQYISNVIKGFLTLASSNLFYYFWPSKKMETKLSACEKLIARLNASSGQSTNCEATAFSDVEKKALNNGELGNIVNDLSFESIIEPLNLRYPPPNQITHPHKD